MSILIQEKIAAIGPLVGVGGVATSMLETIHKLMQIGAAGVSIVAGAFTIYFYTRKFLMDRSGKISKDDK